MMGNRYWLTVICPVCGHVTHQIYHGPNRHFVRFTSRCGDVVDFGESVEDASSEEEIARLRKLLCALKDGYRTVEWYHLPEELRRKVNAALRGNDEAIRAH